MLKVFINILACLWLSTAFAAADTSVNDILLMKEKPEGVIIEIVTGQNDGLDWALPLARDHIDKLRQRFPDMPVAIVTHGREQFALQKTNQEEKQKIHSLTRQLVEDGVSLHVCGTYAGWRGLSEEDFPEYVNVSATGPAQVNDYLAVGFIKLVIRKQK